MAGWIGEYDDNDQNCDKYDHTDGTLSSHRIGEYRENLDRCTDGYVKVYIQVVTNKTQ